MKNIFLYGLCLLFLASCSQDVNNDWSDLKLNGKVKSLRVSFFEVREENGAPIREKINETYSRFNTWGNLDEETWYEKDMIQGKAVYLNNIIGKKMEMNMYTKDGLEKRFLYFYGRRGKLLSHEEEYDADSVFIKRILYRYDRSDHLMGQFWILPDSSTYFRKVFKNDAQGNPVEIYQRSKDEKVSTTFLKYDRRNHMIESKTYNAKDSLVATTRNVYDKWNHVIEQHLDHTDGENAKKITIYYDYQYDDHHNILQKSVIDSEKKVQSMEKYQYDRLNNWVTLEIYSPDGKLIRAVERKIEYYEENVD